MINVYNQFDALVAIKSLENHFANATEKTLKDYFRTGECLLKSRAPDETISDIINNTNSKSTFYKRTSSIRYFLYKTIKDLLELFYEHQHEVYLMEASEFFPDLEEIANFKISPDKNFEKMKSKKTALKGLPSNWREKIVCYSESSKYRLALLTMSLTGCRPSELVTGVNVTITENDISFHIVGSKVSLEKGQPFRTISYPKDSPNPLIKILKNDINKPTANFTVSVEKATNLTVEVRRIAKILWPNHNEPVTCYCFRHQFGADMKKSKKGDDISRALGHATNKTRKRYGHANQGRGFVTDIIVTSARPIKSVTFTPSENSPSFT